MLDRFNPYIRFAKVIALKERNSDVFIAYDHRLFVCLEGSFKAEVGEEYTLSDGDAIFIPQYTPYRLYDADVRMISFNFDLTSDNSHYSESLKTHLYSEWSGERLYNDAVMPYFDKVLKFAAADEMNMLMMAVESFSKKEPLCRELASAYLKCAILQMLKEPIPSKHPAVVEFIRIVAEGYSHDITAAGIACEIGYHEGYLNRLVKAQLGITVSEYIINFRLTKAKKLLDLGYSVTDTAVMCGFSELAYFSRCFKKSEGITPREYRRFTGLL